VGSVWRIYQGIGCSEDTARLVVNPANAPAMATASMKRDLRWLERSKNSKQLTVLSAAFHSVGLFLLALLLLVLFPLVSL